MSQHTLSSYIGETYPILIHGLGTPLSCGHESAAIAYLITSRVPNPPPPPPPQLTLLLLVEPDILKQSNFLNHEIEIIQNIALEKLHRQRNLREIIALEILEKQFSDQSTSYNHT